MVLKHGLLTHEGAGSHVISEQAAYPCWFGADFEAADETKPQALDEQVLCAQ